MNLLKLFDDVRLNKVDYESFCKQVQNHAESAAAQSRLEASQWKQRYENSNQMAKSYMNEFQNRGLMYTPVIYKDAYFTDQPQPKKD